MGQSIMDQFSTIIDDKIILELIEELKGNTFRIADGKASA
jgi:hypothetical protein